MKKLKFLSLAACAALLIGSTTASASNGKIPVEEFTIYSYNLETGEERYIVCDTSFVADKLNNGITDISTPSFLGTDNLIQDDLPGDISPNVIIGGYDYRFHITNTTKKPYSSICSIVTTWNNNTTTLASGCLIGANTVLTAAHAVYDSERGGQAKQIQVSPGANGSSHPFGTFNTRTVYATDTWKYDRGIDDDWAVLKITDLVGRDARVGWTTGFLGMDYISTGSLIGTSVYVTGYPGDKDYKTMWRGGGSITDSTTKRIYYSCDTMNGDSGAPVTDTYDRIIGIHNSAGHIENNKAIDNRGIRVTSKLISTVNSLA